MLRSCDRRLLFILHSDNRAQLWNKGHSPAFAATLGSAKFECEKMSENLSVLQEFAIARSALPDSEGVLTVSASGMLIQLRIDDHDARQILEEVLSFLGFPAEAPTSHAGSKRTRSA